MSMENDFTWLAKAHKKDRLKEIIYQLLELIKTPKIKQELIKNKIIKDLKKMQKELEDE